MKAQTTNIIDPVCGMQINPETAAASSTLKGQTFHFCSRGCATKFDTSPERYSQGPEKGASCCSTSHSCC